MRICSKRGTTFFLYLVTLGLYSRLKPNKLLLLKMTRINKKKNNMHPRNVLRTPPDYTKLAIKYKDFRKVCDLNLNGKVSVDFRNEQALRELAKMLLLEYFDLKVDFAPGSLVPTLALRLNYVLWLEDLLEPLKLDTVRGIDIGCGSSCVYSLLAAKKNKWHMLALESKEINIEYAQKNIERNELQSLIEVYQQPDKTTIFKSYFESPNATKEQFHFCICNPPFFDSNSPNPFAGKTRNPTRRPAPKTVRTGSAEELTCEGGEVEFVKRIIDESLLYKERVSIFTTMLGIKANLPKILDYLKAQNISNTRTTEFYQGHTNRWSVAWSFQKEAISDTSSN
ncbi:U6 small nuclear RNA (adenine-(43)-N(6))-methyltransferase [Scaptodrosophila lebanonensis]|uniref:U6 small nuclear RNA (adenine-(43)-N(6))-methyltransferase n=1 Tax=Drosophila lebanonensis TaxID=7225 RepID=A0A6J2ULK4_DROLE|nr:U6 small nuclear RNA (adenine-(43)-N(6))-methyltransferase [Scaptodrosophila lebanonensis]